ncbi:terpene cyclase/mutase family protein [PVC group bacterium]|nr:terpene cyclase/mutase family protein [PVC group bacterium]
MEVKVVEPETLDDLEDIEEPIDQEIPPPEEMDFEITTADPTVTPTENAPTPETDFSPQPVEFDAVAMTKSPVIMKGIYGSRNSGSRGEAMLRFGGTASEVPVLRALRWLKKNQNEDGSWNKTKSAMTALALLAYLAHGDTTASAEFGSTVQGAITYLAKAGVASNGRFKGNYEIPIGTYALCEAYAITRIPKLKEICEANVDFVIKGQHPSGGWDYSCKQTQRDDTSYMGWCVQALKAAKMAGIPHPNLRDAMEKAVHGFKKNFKGKDGYGGFGYTSPSIGNLTGIGVLCMQFLGASKTKECKAGLKTLEKATCDWQNPMGQSPLYYWYYITQAKFHEGDNVWNAWNKQFSPTLIKNQKVVSKDLSGYIDHKGKPQEIGSWISPGKKEHTGGNGEVMDTILCTLMLEVYYRYLPTFQPPDDKEEEEIGGEEDELEIDIVNRSPAFLPADNNDKKNNINNRDDLNIDIV